MRISQGIALLSGLFALRPFECPYLARAQPPSLATHHPATAHALATNRLACLDRALLLSRRPGSPGLISISKSSTRQPTHPSTSCPLPELSTPIDKSESSLSPLTFSLARRRWRKTEQIADPLVSSNYLIAFSRTSTFHQLSDASVSQPRALNGLAQDVLNADVLSLRSYDQQRSQGPLQDLQGSPSSLRVRSSRCRAQGGSRQIRGDVTGGGAGYQCWCWCWPTIRGGKKKQDSGCWTTSRGGVIKRNQEGKLETRPAVQPF